MGHPSGDEVAEPECGSAGGRRAVALQNGGHITLGLQCTAMTPHSLQADVFAYGIILCETIARVPADPDYLPRTEVTLRWEQGELWVAALGLGPLHQILCWAETHVRDWSHISGQGCCVPLAAQGGVVSAGNLRSQ